VGLRPATRLASGCRPPPAAAASVGEGRRWAGVAESDSPASALARRVPTESVVCATLTRSPSSSCVWSVVTDLGQEDPLAVRPARTRPLRGPTPRARSRRASRAASTSTPGRWRDHLRLIVSATSARTAPERGHRRSRPEPAGGDDDAAGPQPWAHRRPGPAQGPARCAGCGVSPGCCRGRRWRRRGRSSRPDGWRRGGTPGRGRAGPSRGRATGRRSRAGGPAR
jgi:hypothetical protein